MERDFALDALRYNGGMKVINKIIHWILFSWLSNRIVWFLIAYVIIVALIFVLIVFIASPELATAITSIATITLAFAAFWTIWQNYKFREKDRKERLFNEIIEWAIDVIKCGSTVNIQSTNSYYKTLIENNFVDLKRDKQQMMLNALNKDIDHVLINRFAELLFKYQVVDARGEYILNVSKVFPEKINSNVIEVKEKLVHTQKTLKDYIENISNELNRQRVSDYEHELQESGKSLIKVITDFKNKGVN
jgi:hypothetical protein